MAFCGGNRIEKIRFLMTLIKPFLRLYKAVAAYALEGLPLPLEYFRVFPSCLAY